MARAGPRKVQRYSLEFKLKAVKLSQLKGVEVRAVADALEIHPFMLSRWRKEARDGVLRGRTSITKGLKTPRVHEIRRYQALQRAHALLQEEHALLKKLIRFTSARKPPSSRSSPKNGKRSEWRGCVGCSAWRDLGSTRGVGDRKVHVRGRTGNCSRRCVRSSSGVAGRMAVHGCIAICEPAATLWVTDGWNVWCAKVASGREWPECIDPRPGRIGGSANIRTRCGGFRLPGRIRSGWETWRISRSDRGGGIWR